MKPNIRDLIWRQIDTPAEVEPQAVQHREKQLPLKGKKLITHSSFLVVNISFDALDHWTTRSSTSSVSFKFSEGENISRTIISFYHRCLIDVYGFRTVEVGTELTQRAQAPSPKGETLKGWNRGNSRRNLSEWIWSSGLKRASLSKTWISDYFLFLY